MRRGTGFQPVGLAGVSPASRDPAGSPLRVRVAAATGQDARLSHSQDDCAPETSSFSTVLDAF